MFHIPAHKNVLHPAGQTIGEVFPQLDARGNPVPAQFDDITPAEVSAFGPLDQGIRKDAGKTRLDLIDWAFVYHTADVLAFGAIKYAPNGWRKGMAWTRAIGSMLRHTIAYAMGQDLDPESGLSHLGHIGCNLMFLAAYRRDKGTLDDRVKVM